VFVGIAIVECLSLDLRPSKNTKSPLVYRQGALLSNTRYIGSDALILSRQATISITPVASGTRERYISVVSRLLWPNQSWTVLICTPWASQ